MRRNILRLSRSNSVSISAYALVSRLVSAISASSLNMVPGTGRADRDAFAIMLAVEHDAPADHDIGRNRPRRPRGKACGRPAAVAFRAEGEQAQLFLREPSKSLTAGQDANVVIQRHATVPERSVQSLPWSAPRSSWTRKGRSEI